MCCSFYGKLHLNADIIRLDFSQCLLLSPFVLAVTSAVRALHKQFLEFLLHLAIIIIVLLFLVLLIFCHEASVISSVIKSFFFVVLC